MEEQRMKEALCVCVSKYIGEREMMMMMMTGWWDGGMVG